MSLGNIYFVEFGYIAGDEARTLVSHATLPRVGISHNTGWSVHRSVAGPGASRLRGARRKIKVKYCIAARSYAPGTYIVSRHIVGSDPPLTCI